MSTFPPKTVIPRRRSLISLASKGDQVIQLLTIKQASATLSVSRATLYRFIKRGDINVVYLGRSVRISKNELERFVDLRIQERR